MSSANEWKMTSSLIANKKREIASYNERKKKELAPLIAKQAQLARSLYEYMCANDLETYNGIDIDQVAPKQKIVKDKVSKDERLETLRKMGIRNPVAALEELGIK